MAGRPTAVIYFNPTAGAMAKDLASRVRNDPRGINTLLCWGNKFRDERDVESCQAVMIQRSMSNAPLIASCYQNFAAGVEIHFIDDAGAFEDDDSYADITASKPQADPPAPEADEPNEPGTDNQPEPEAEAPAGADIEAAGAGEAEPDPAAA